MGRLRLILKGIALILMVYFNHYIIAQTPARPIYEDLGRTQGYILGQQYALDRIKSDYPALFLQALTAEHEFMSSFGTATKKIENALKEDLKDGYLDFIEPLKNQVRNMLMSQQINYEDAINFLDEVKIRGQGDIPSPMLETLLHYQYEDRPANEFSRGYTVVYRTGGHPKAKGLDVQIEYPKSWSSREGKRPNIIQFFGSNNGRGSAYASLLVRDLSNEIGKELTPEEVVSLKTLEGSKEAAVEIFSDANMREMATGMGMNNIQGIAVKRLIVDRWPSGLLTFIGDRQQLDMVFTAYNHLYLILFKNYLVFVQFQVAEKPSDTREDFNAKISIIVPLFRLMANSIIIQSQYVRE